MMLTYSQIFGRVLIIVFTSLSGFMVFEHLFRVERILTLLLAGCFGWLGAMVSIRPPVSRTNGREPESDTPDPLMPPRPDLRLGRCRRVSL